MKAHERTFVNKGWGHEDWIVNKPEYCGKLLFVKKDKRMSLHFHKLKDETFYCQSGTVKIEHYENPELDKLATDWEAFDSGILEHTVTFLSPGDSFYIPVGMRHSVSGLGRNCPDPSLFKDSEIFEFSTQHFDEDSYRIIQGD